jgi:hypothetical protein
MTANFIIVDLTRGGALLSVIIIHHQARVNDSWNPAEQSQNDTEKETGDAARHEYRERRQHYTEKISQRFHFSLLISLCRAVALAEADDLCNS